jgi:hypothetical protein
MVKKEPIPKRKSFLDSPEMIEAKNLMERYKKTQKDLTELLDKFQEKSNMSPNDVKALFDNPKNFSPEQWEVVKAEKDKVFQMMDSFKDVLKPKKKKAIEDIKMSFSGKKKSGIRARGIKQKWILVK